MLRCNPLDRPTRAAVFARMERLFPSRACLPLAVAALVGFGAAPASRAATIVVNSTADPGDAGTCTLRQATVSMNTGALTANSACTNTGSAFGTNDTINFANSLFNGNSATITLANGLYVGVKGGNGTSLTIDAGAGNNVTVERAAAASNHFSVIQAVLGPTQQSSLHLSGLTVQNGYARNIDSQDPTCGWFCPRNSVFGYPAGGGIHAVWGTVTLDRCVISNNHAYQGGGVWVDQGSLFVNSSLVTGNVAGGNLTASGGGLWATGPITVNNSTISGNTTQSSTGGAAVANYFNSLAIVDSTISGNYSGGGSQVVGSAIFAALDPSVILLNSTFACNGSYNKPAIGAAGNSSATVSISAINTIFADASNSLCTTRTTKEISPWQGPYVLVSGDHNLVISSSAIDSSAPFPADTVFGDPLLGPLQNNGGPTSTHALGIPSPPNVNPAIDAGSNPSSLAYDQRGPDFTRWVGKAPDIGAYEVQTVKLCGTANGQSFASISPSTPNLCSSGAYLQGGSVNGSGPWSWLCAANASPANNEFCGAQVLASISLLIENASGGPITSAVWGQPLHLKAVAAGGGATPTGTMSFFDVTGGGFVPVCVDLALSSGEALCDTTNSPVDAGTRQLEAVYNGDGAYGTATSSAGSIPNNPAASTTAIASQTPNPVSAGSPFKVVANVTPNAPSVATPNGIVQITDQTDNLTCSYPLGISTPGCAITPRSLGVHSLLVAYPGNNNIGGSSVTGQETVDDVIFRNGFE